MYKSERNLQEVFIKNILKNKKDNQEILEEFNARFGNVDVVKVDYNKVGHINKRQAELLSIYSYALTIAFLHKRKPRTLSYLIKHTGYTRTMLIGILSSLRKETIIEEKEDKYIISSDFEFPKLKFVAYELKLRDWQKAIIQAVKNTNFAQYSYVVMPDDIANRIAIRYKDIFDTYNIGLIGVSDKENNEYIKPKIFSVNYNLNPTLISSTAKYILKRPA